MPAALSSTTGTNRRCDAEGRAAAEAVTPPAPPRPARAAASSGPVSTSRRRGAAT